MGRTNGRWLWLAVVLGGLALSAPQGASAEPDEDDEPEASPPAAGAHYDFGGLDVSAELVSPAAPMRMRAKALGATPGGAQDIGYFRDRVREGDVPLPQVFTPEGLFSEHDLPLAEAEPCERLMCTNAKAVAGRLPAQDDVRWLAQLGFSSGLDPATWQRAPLNLVAVVDKSCSMSAQPIDTVRASLRELVDHHLGPDDQLSIVAYGATVATVLEPTAGSDKAALHRAIERVVIDGSTNMEAGLQRGFELARSSRRSFDGTTRVMLFTDERPNTGRTDAAGFMGMAQAASLDHIGMTTVGVGVQFGAELAQQISSTRGGNLFFFPDAGAMKDRFHDDFDTMVTELAHDLVVEVHPADGLRIAGLYGVPGEAVEWTDDGGMRLAVTTVFLSKDRGGLYVGLAPDSERPTPVRVGGPVAELSLSYDPLDGGRQGGSTTVSVVRPGAGDEGLTRGLALVDEASTLKRATALYHQDNDPEGAWQLVHALRGRLEALPDGTLEPERDLVRSLEQTLGQLAGRVGEPEVLQSRRDPVTGLPQRR